jgi:hypothetical protein
MKTTASALGLLTAFAALVSATAFAEEKSPGIPAEYKLAYSQDFKNPDALKDFTFTDPTAWKITEADGKAALELVKQSDYKPQYRSPFNIARLTGKTFGDVIIEADCMQMGREYGHRDMVFVYGWQSPTQFYYTHIATAADDHAHNCFIVNNAPREKFAREVTKGVNWGLNVWRKVRIERKVSDGSVRVFFEDMTKPIMVAEDKTFGPGEIGFGSFDDTGKITNIKVYAPVVPAR